MRKQDAQNGSQSPELPAEEAKFTTFGFRIIYSGITIPLYIIRDLLDNTTPKITCLSV